MPTTETVYLPTRCRNEAGLLAGNITREGGRLQPCIVTSYTAAETAAARSRGIDLSRGRVMGRPRTGADETFAQRLYGDKCQRERKPVDETKMQRLGQPYRLKRDDDEERGDADYDPTASLWKTEADKEALERTGAEDIADFWRKVAGKKK